MAADISPELTYTATLKTSAQVVNQSDDTDSVTARNTLETIQREEMEDTLTINTTPRVDTARKETLVPTDTTMSSIVVPDGLPNGSSSSMADQLSLRGYLRNPPHQPKPPSYRGMVPHDLSSSSPDSGYGLTPEGVIRSRSCSSDTSTANDDSGVSSRRTTGSSGIPSSIYSGHESNLEFVAEGDDEIGKEEEGDGCVQGLRQGNGDFYQPDSQESSVIDPLLDFGRHTSVDGGRTYSTTSTDSYRDLSSISGSYFSPDGSDILVPVMKRKGIQRSASLENEFRTSGVPFNDSNTLDKLASTQPSSSRKSPGRKDRRRTTLGRKTKSVIKDSSGRPPFLIEGKDTFQIQDDLSKDNHHFSLSEALLCVIEEYKSRLHEQAYDEYLTKRSIGSNSSDTLCSPTHLEEGYDDADDSFLHSAVYIDRESSDRVIMMEVKEDNDSPRSFRESTNSLRQKWLEENYRANISRATSLGDTVSVLQLINSPAPNDSAEGTANGLLQHIAKVLAGNAQIEFRIPEKAIQLPTDFVASIQKQEMLRYSVSDTSVPIRGSSDWAPPRKQVLHKVFPPPNDIRGTLVAQGGKCAGCSMTLDPTQFKNLRFCNYIGKYFCASCHHNSYSYIPGRIINDWNFTRYPVSNFARDTLNDIQKEPLFNIESLNPSLYGKVSKLNKIKNYKTQLVHLRKYVSTCSRAAKLRADYDEYLSVSTGDVHVYSLDELISVRFGYLVKDLKQLVAEGEKHVKACPVCQGKGFVCEFCRDDQTILFPFQLNTVSQCPNCSSCYHKSCYKNKKCPKCERLKERQKQRVKTVLSNEEDPKS